MQLRNLKTTIYAVSVATLSLSLATASFAQSRQNQQGANALGDLIGSIAQASAKSKAKKGWAQVAPEIQQCVNKFFESKNINVEQIIAAGLSPTHEKMAPIITMCQAVMATQLKADFPCKVPNSKGEQVATTCVQSYSKAVNGKWVPVSRDDFLRAAGNNEQVNVADFETVAAQTARLAEEKRLAQEAAAKAEAARIKQLEEQRRFAASPEGKRQAAQQAAQRAARERRELAEAQMRPRTVQILCADQITHSDKVSYNIYQVNCRDVNAVKRAYLWGTRKLEADNRPWISHWSQQCAGALRQYSSWMESGRAVETAGSRLFYFCNEGLRQGQVK